MRAVYALRSLALVRAVLGANRAARAVAQILGRGGFQYVLAIVFVAALVGAGAVSFFERTVPGSALGRFPEALWWSAALVTTVNTDLDPVTVEGRVIALLLRVLALAVFGYIAGSIASFLLGEEAPRPGQGEGEDAELAALAAIQRQLDELSARLERLERGR